MCAHKFCWMTKSMLNEIIHNSSCSGTFTRGYMDPRVTHEGVLWGNVSRHALFRIPSAGAHTGKGLVTVTSWPWPMPVCSDMYHRVAHLEENELSYSTCSFASTATTHTYKHTLPIILKVLHHCSTMFPLSRWAERTKGHVLLTICEHTLNRFPLIAFIYLRQSWLSVFAVLQKHRELHSASLAV